MNSNDLYLAFGEVDDDILERSERRGRGQAWVKWATMAACFALILTAAVAALPGLLRGQSGVVPPVDPDVPGPVVSAANEPSDIDPLEPPREQNVIINWDKVFVNESAVTLDSARLYRDPELYTEETWGEEEIVAYYGWNLAPGYIPEGLTGGGWGVAAGIWREKATGEIVEEQAGRGFWTDFWEDGSPKSDDDLYIPTGFTVTASKLGILHCALLPVDGSKTTDFGGVSVTLSHCSMPHGPYDPTQKAPDGLHNMPAGYYDIYVAAFSMDGVEYEIEAQRLELEEVIKIVASIINIPTSENFAVGGNSK